MKYRKVIATVLATSMVLGIVGCQKKEETSISGTEGSTQIVFESSETSAEMVEETVEETVEKTVEETVEETTEETTEATTKETIKETTKETEGTAPTEKPGNGTPAPTPKPTYEKRDTPPQEAIDSMGVQKINIDGYGEVWVHYYEASSVNNQVNEYRTSIGVSTLSVGDTSTAKKRAAENAVCFSHTRPNGQDFSTLGIRGENITTAYYSDAFNGFLNSPAHKSTMESTGYSQISCACAYVYVWTPRENEWGGRFDIVGSGTVMCFW